MRSRLELEVALNEPLSNQERSALNEFKGLVNSNGLEIVEANDSVVIYLREADTRFMKSTGNAIIEQYGLLQGNIIERVLTKIESIKSYGVKAGKRVYVGYNEERKVKGRKAKERKRGLYFYAKDNGFSKINNEFPDEYIDRIICADSEEFLKTLPDNCVDLVLTSPPYNFGLEYGEIDDDHVWDRYFDKLFRVFSECIRVVKYGGRIVVNVQPLFSDYIPSHHIISNYFIENNLIWKAEIQWEKHNYNCKYTAWGSWKSPSSPYFKYTWEFIEIFCKGDLKKGGSKDKIDISGDEFKEWVYAKWSIAPENKMKEFGHPAMFPEALVERVLKLLSYRDDVILDPFNGAGTTTYVAEKLGRRYLGIDISKEYCETATRRIRERLF